jgi:hypothetical protein
MEFLKNIEWSPFNILKALGLLLLALIIISFTIRILSPISEVVMQNSRDFSMSTSGSRPAYDTNDGYSYAEEAVYGEGGSVKLSINNVSNPSPEPGGSVGGDVEDYEVTQYSASIETRDSNDTCTEISSLKDLDYVIFENTNEYDRGCRYTFKVEHEKVAEVLATIEAFDPKKLSENTYTIKRQLDDFTSETEILENKLASISETLESAISAYDEIAVLARRTQDAESLAKIIDSKINTIERLTQQRINITAQLERLSRGKAEQLDRLEYTYFSVDVYENRVIDGESIKESWKGAVKGFVRDINRTAQDISINLVALLFVLFQYILYFFILLFVAKYLWRFTQGIWKK